jgi:hypothetical protein
MKLAAFDGALSMIVIVRCCAPCFVGENIAPIVHFARGATLGPHVESSELCAALWVEIDLHPRMRSIAGALPRQSPRENSVYNPLRRCSSALKFAPASSNNPVRNAQNIRVTDKAKGP